MARGKYSAKAANRLAALDNALLQQKIAEVAELKGQLAQRDAMIAQERAERDAHIVTRGNELSQRLVVSAQADTLAVQAECNAAKREVAEWLIDYMTGISEENPSVGIIPGDIEDILQRLVGNDVGDYVGRILAPVDPTWSNRAHRRLSHGAIKANRADKDRPIHARGYTRVGYAEPLQ